MTLQMKLPDPQRAKQFFENKLSFTTGPIEVDYFRRQGGPCVLVDVRAQEDYEEDHIPGAVNLPEDRWNTYEGLRKDLPNVIYCYSQACHLAARAAVKFAGAGFPVMEMEGGFETWKEDDLETETGAYKEEEESGEEKEAA